MTTNGATGEHHPGVGRLAGRRILAACQAMVREADERLGGLDGVVLNVGIGAGR